MKQEISGSHSYSLEKPSPMIQGTVVFVFVASVILAALFSPWYPQHVSANAMPKGSLDHADVNVIYGWAYDSDLGSAPAAVHIYIDGMPTVALTANKRRDDLTAAQVTSDPFHGFEWTPPPLSQGTHTIQAFAINAPQGMNPELKGTRTVTITETVANRKPVGFLDSAIQREISGWAYDLDAGASPMTVHIYIDGNPTAAILADQRRDDLVVAGAAPDPFHGFTFVPPSLSAGNHEIKVFAINVPEGSNPELGSSPRTISVAQGEHGGTAFIENGVLRVGVNLNWGGAITEFSHAGTNLVDDNDTGRLIQVSVYDQTESYPINVTDPSWGWNPVQGGDKYLHGSMVLDFSKTGESMHIKTQTLQWNPDNKGGGATTPVPSELMLETWLTFSSRWPQLLEVRHKLLLDGTKTRTGNEEIPALFAKPFLDRLVTYTGNSPWTNGTVTSPAIPVYPSIATIFPTPERWIAFVNRDNFGTTLYVPNHPESGGFNVYRVEGEEGTNYARPSLSLTLQPNAPYEITYYLIIGNYFDARSLLVQLRAANHRID